MKPLQLRLSISESGEFIESALLLQILLLQAPKLMKVKIANNRAIEPSGFKKIQE